MAHHLAHSHNRFTAGWSCDADAGVVKRMPAARVRARTERKRS